MYTELCFQFSMEYLPLWVVEDCKQSFANVDINVLGPFLQNFGLCLTKGVNLKPGKILCMEREFQF